MRFILCDLISVVEENHIYGIYVFLVEVEYLVEMLTLLMFSVCSAIYRK